MEVTFIQNKVESEGNDHKTFDRKVGFLTRLFGCGHQNLSRPFSPGKAGYRTCLGCGARKRFNPETLETSGAFYYPQTFIAE